MAAENILSVENLRFSYTKTENGPTFSIPHFALKKSEWVLLKGPSGVGKTTFLKLLLGLLTPQAGQIFFGDEDILSFTPSGRDQWRADHIGVIYQQFNLIPYLSPLQNIELSTYFSKSKRLRVGERLSEDLLTLLRSLGIDDSQLLKRPASQLSMGQQQRVAAVRALIGSPEILIADEPTSHLDFERRNQFMNFIHKQTKERNMSVLMVSHDTGLETYFDRIVQFTDVVGAQ